MLIVGNDPELVEADLGAGSVACPGCGGILARWGSARRRTLRGESVAVVVRPRRARCRSCRSTHVLLPDVGLLRRVDAVGVIGRALRLAAGGVGHRRVAERVGRAASTVRGWLRRFRWVAARVAAHFAAWALRLDPNLGVIAPAGSGVGDALEAIGVAARAASLRLGSRPPWSWVSVLTAGRLLSNTNTPWLAP
jgi:transposase-like protein